MKAAEPEDVISRALANRFITKLQSVANFVQLHDERLALKELQDFAAYIWKHTESEEKERARRGQN